MKRILLVIGGGIAAYKCLDLIRRARERGYAVRAVMTRAATEFVTPLSVGALTGDRVFQDLFSLDDEREIGHIRLSRAADIIVVAPATADLMARMANGLADDLATAVLLATDKPVLIAPAMNPLMWQHPATRRNVEHLVEDGIAVVGPNIGEMAERNEAGPGRMAEPLEILAAIDDCLGQVSASGAEEARHGPLAGRHVIVTSGPTHEPIDPVRYIANRSSGKQGHAIAAAAAALGARVTLVSGPTEQPDPAGVDVIAIESAREMLAAVKAALPADCAVFAAAVADWRVASESGEKIKKDGDATLRLELVQNPDILVSVAKLPPGQRPPLVIGFAAETENVVAYARRKLASKGCDWIIANDVSPETGIMGGDRNRVHLVTEAGVESWPEMDKTAVAEAIMERASAHLAAETAQA